MALDPKTEQANRLAARARKKRGRGGNGKKDESVKPLTLAQLTTKNKQHAEYKARVRHDTARTIRGYIEQVEKSGSAIIPDTLENYNTIAKGVKDHFYGNAAVRWMFVDRGLAFAAVKVQPAK